MIFLIANTEEETLELVERTALDAGTRVWRAEDVPPFSSNDEVWYMENITGELQSVVELYLSQCYPAPLVNRVLVLT